MAKLTFILTLFLISFSYITISSSIPENDVNEPTLLLPSQKHELEETTSVGFAEIVPDKTLKQKPEEITTVGFAEISEDKTEVTVTETQDHVDRPMKIVRFHPINRHFPVNRLGSLRLPHHRCHHDTDDKAKNGYRERRMYVERPREFSFGDDMMVRAGENGDFDPMVHVEVRHVPERWIIHRHHRHHHHDGIPRFPPMGKHHDFFANHRFREEMHGKEERQEGSLMRSVRKFLNGRF